jgi:hypothetical protein
MTGDVVDNVPQRRSRRRHTGALHRGRHAVVAVALGAGAAACGAAVAHAAHRNGSAAHGSQPPSSRASLASAPQSSSRPVAAARTVSAARLDPGESFPALKRLAQRTAVALTTYSPSDSADTVAARVAASPASRRALATALAPLFHRGATSTGTVVYPQMGGATADRVSVMVVIRQTFSRPGRAAVTQTRTLDIRLLRTPAGWRFDALASAGGTPVARPATLSAAARHVVDNPRVFLPDTARWDIYRGAISPQLLELLARIATRVPIAVTVLETGHPYDVFGTSHASLHSSGRAVDINMLNGVHVVRQHAVGSPAYDLVRWLLAQPQVSQVGSPWDLDGASGRSFTNTVHLDHIHVSV